MDEAEGPVGMLNERGGFDPYGQTLPEWLTYATVRPVQLTCLVCIVRIS